MNNVFSFEEMLEFSNNKQICIDLNNFYKENFGTYGLEIESIELSPRELQKHGIDKIIKLKDGTCFSIEEKIRANSYDDIVLETWSVVGKEKGWVYKTLSDYVVYYKSKKQELYLIPTNLLKIVWNKNHEKWEQKYKKIRNATKDRGYESEFICIPEDIFFDEIANANYINDEMTGKKDLK